MTTLGALEMWLWSVVWTLFWRLFRRMVRNAKVDLVSEVIAFCVEGLKLWGLDRRKVIELVEAAYDAPAGPVNELLTATKKPLLEPKSSQTTASHDFSRDGAARDPQASELSDRPTAAGPGGSTPPAARPPESGGGS